MASWLARYAQDSLLQQRNSNVVPREQAQRICSESAINEAVYHGTGSAEDIFFEGIRQFRARTFRGDIGAGAYVTPDPMEAERFGPQILECRINVGNPLDLADHISFIDDEYVRAAIRSKVLSDMADYDDELDTFAETLEIYPPEDMGWSEQSAWIAAEIGRRGLAEQFADYVAEEKQADYAMGGSINLTVRVPPFALHLGGKIYEFTGSDEGIATDYGYRWEDVGSVAAEHGYDSVISTLDVNEILVFDFDRVYVVLESILPYVEHLEKESR